MPIPQPSSFDGVSPMDIDGEQQQQQQQQQQVVEVAERNGRRRSDRLVLSEEPSTNEARIEGEQDTKTKTKTKMMKNEEKESSSSSIKVDKDELCCVICTEPWTSQGDHHVCCLPCGHLFGMSCIHKWILHRGKRSKCPQCNTLCSQADIRKIYASPVYIDNEDLKKKVGSLKAEVGSLKAERADLQKSLKALQKLKEKPVSLESLRLGEMGLMPHRFIFKEVQERQSGHAIGPSFGRQGSLHCNFVLEHELVVEGARVFDMNTSYQILILARRISGMGGIHMLNKINLINPLENEDIAPPPRTKAIKDLCVSPCGRLALLASLGKKLSILNMGSNDFCLMYNLPVPAWSCSWDRNRPNYMYAGLQNGSILVFDMRRNIRPLQSIGGLTSEPIHTIHSLMCNPFNSASAGKLLTASSIGPCVWDTGDSGKRPFLLPELKNQGICVSLAYSPSSEDIVVSYIPQVSTPNDVLPQRKLGSQVYVKRMLGNFYREPGSASVHISTAQMTRSAIINVENCIPLLAYGDKFTRGLGVHELSSLTISQNLFLPPHQQPILDVKYTNSQGPGLLGCISEDKLQILSANVM